MARAPNDPVDTAADDSAGSQAVPGGPGVTRRANRTGDAAIVKACGVPRSIAARSDAGLLKAHFIAIYKHRQRFEERLEEARGRLERQDPADKGRVTEAIGERAATLFMLKERATHTIIVIFAPGTGFDQLWIEGTPPDCTYVIVEAKGPRATLSRDANKGEQMSKQWVRATLEEIMRSQERSTDMFAHAKRMLCAMEFGPPPKVTGLVLQAVDRRDGPAEALLCPDHGIYHAVLSGPRSPTQC